MGTVSIRTEGLGKSFARAFVLSDVDLSVAAGELVALLGPSGSGKTTLLRLVAGLERPTMGQVFFGDEDATAMPVQLRQVGFVFQNYALFKHLTVADNIAYGLRVRPRRTRPSRAVIRRRVSDLLDLVQLPGLERRFPAQLSGGQRQRVALARALAVDPKVLLLDEPFGALDAQVRRDLRRWLRDLHDRTGHTTLFVTHDQDEALELADRVAILNRGRIEQIGRPDEVYDRPAGAFVAGFIGGAIRVPVELEPGALRIGAHVIPSDHGLTARTGALFVRPRDLVLADGAAANPQLAAAPGPAIPVRVTGLRRVGAARHAELEIAAGLPAIEIELPTGLPVSAGDRLHVRFLILRVFPA